MTSTQVDYVAINTIALAVLPVILHRWLPDGHIIGHEYIARNPTRNDRHAGSFKINVRTGRWADFATGDVGGDPISLHRPALANRRVKGLSPDPISAESPHHALLPIVHVLARQAAKYTLARDRQPTPDQPSSEDEA